MENKFKIIYKVRRYNSFTTYHEITFEQWKFAFEKFKSLRSCPNCEPFYFGKLKDYSLEYFDIYYPLVNVNDLRKKWWRNDD